VERPTFEDMVIVILASLVFELVGEDVVEVVWRDTRSSVESGVTI
jgi:hypothetical protein